MLHNNMRELVVLMKDGRIALINNYLDDETFFGSVYDLNLGSKINDVVISSELLIDSPNVNMELFKN